METYTYVRYFSNESPGMAELAQAYGKIELDFEARKDGMSPQARSACERRVTALRLAWAGLVEPVPKPFEF